MPKAKNDVELILGDFLVQSPKHIEEGSIDAVVTSPPYNIGAAYSGYKDNLPREKYLEWIGLWAAEVKRTLSPKGSLFLNVGVRPSESWAAWEVAEIFRAHFKLQNVIHWIKSISIVEKDLGQCPSIRLDVTAGHYKPINSGRFLNDAHEYVFHFTHDGAVPIDRLAIGVPYEDASNLKRWHGAEEGVHCRGNTWFIPYPTINFRSKDRPHPATFPPRLPELCFLLHGKEKIRRAMDPFLGLGSSAIAAQKLKIPFVGFEIDEVYLDYARQALLQRAEEAAEP